MQGNSYYRILPHSFHATVLGRYAKWISHNHQVRKNTIYRCFIFLIRIVEKRWWRSYWDAEVIKPVKCIESHLIQHRILAVSSWQTTNFLKNSYWAYTLLPTPAGSFVLKMRCNCRQQEQNAACLSSFKGAVKRATFYDNLLPSRFSYCQSRLSCIVYSC